MSRHTIKVLIGLALAGILGALTILAFNFLFSNLMLVAQVLLIVCLITCICERVQKMRKR